jgi:hypothetical protein
MNLMSASCLISSALAESLRIRLAWARSFRTVLNFRGTRQYSYHLLRIPAQFAAEKRLRRHYTKVQLVLLGHQSLRL